MTKRRGPCPTGKHRYRDDIAAALALSQRDHDVLRAYRCSDCRGWHLTSWTTNVPAAVRAHSDGRIAGDDDAQG